MRATARPVEGVTEQLRSGKLSHTRARCASATRSGAAIGLTEIGLAPRSSKNRSAVCRTPLASSALRGRSRSRLQVDVDAAGEGKHRRVPGQDAVHKPVGAARPPTEAAHKRSQPTTRLINQPTQPTNQPAQPTSHHTARLKMSSSTTVDDKHMAFKVTFSGDLQHSNNITL